MSCDRSSSFEPQAQDGPRVLTSPFQQLQGATINQWSAAEGGWVTQPVAPTALAALNSPSKGLPVALEQMQHTPLPWEHHHHHQLTHSLQQSHASLSDAATSTLLFCAHELGRYLTGGREQQQQHNHHNSQQQYQRQSKCDVSKEGEAGGWGFLCPTGGGLVKPRSSQDDTLAGSSGTYRALRPARELCSDSESSSDSPAPEQHPKREPLPSKGSSAQQAGAAAYEALLSAPAAAQRFNERHSCVTTSDREVPILLNTAAFNRLRAIARQRAGTLPQPGSQRGAAQQQQPDALSSGTSSDSDGPCGVSQVVPSTTGSWLWPVGSVGTAHQVRAQEGSAQHLHPHEDSAGCASNSDGPSASPRRADPLARRPAYNPADYTDPGALCGDKQLLSAARFASRRVSSNGGGAARSRTASAAMPNERAGQDSSSNSNSSGGSSFAPDSPAAAVPLDTAATLAAAAAALSARLAPLAQLRGRRASALNLGDCDAISDAAFVDSDQGAIHSSFHRVGMVVAGAADGISMRGLGRPTARCDSAAAGSSRLNWSGRVSGVAKPERRRWAVPGLGGASLAAVGTVDGASSGVLPGAACVITSTHTTAPRHPGTLLTSPFQAAATAAGAGGSRRRGNNSGSSGERAAASQAAAAALKGARGPGPSGSYAARLGRQASSHGAAAVSAVSSSKAKQQQGQQQAGADNKRASAAAGPAGATASPAAAAKGGPEAAGRSSSRISPTGYQRRAQYEQRRATNQRAKARVHRLLHELLQSQPGATPQAIRHRVEAAAAAEFGPSAGLAAVRFVYTHQLWGPASASGTAAANRVGAFLDRYQQAQQQPCRSSALLHKRRAARKTAKQQGAAAAATQQRQ